MSEDKAVSTESEEREPGSTHSSAHELGDITAQRLQGGLQKLEQTVGTEGDAVDYYRFTLSEAREVRLGLKLRQGGAELSVEDAEGNVLARSMAYAGYEAAVRTLLPGTYYVRVEAVGAAASEYEFRYGVLEANASFRPASHSAWYAGLAAKMGMPSFGEAGYGFELSEAADGRVSGVLLGTVLAVDPNGESLSYGIVGGNGSGLFALDGASGELSYVGSGEDFEGGVTSHKLTVRASDGTHTIDTTVTVAITDAAEGPAFGEASYAFELAENADGSVERLSLGAVTATDPDGDVVRYSLSGGNDSSLFAIDETSGELYYVGAGEDYESGSGPHKLTVRASDGAHTIDTTVTVTITDAAEAPAFGEASYAFELSENVDGSVNRLSLGVVTATDPDGGSVRYSLAGGNGSGLFAIDAVSGELFYVGAGEDFESGAGSYELTARASDAAHTMDTTVTVTVTNAAEAPLFGDESYAFELTENVDGRVNRISPGTVEATDPDGGSVRYSLAGGNESGLFAIDAVSGELFYVGPGVDYESGSGPHELTVRASDGTHTIDTTVTVTITDEAEAPAFAEESYAFALSENAEGSVNRLSLGVVEATDPDGDVVRYSLVGGNESGLFAIDAVSGELFYVGAGEDFESGAGSYELTARASDAAHTVDTTVTVTVTNAAEAPLFGDESYAFELTENVDGSVNRISLGAVEATDPDGDAVRYSLSGGNDSGLFAIDEASGELSYVGSGEDYEGGADFYELTVRASDGTHTVDTTVTVTVVDDPSDSEKTTGPQGSSEPAGEDLPAGRETSGEVRVNAEPVAGTLRSQSDRDWFAVTLASGRTYAFNLEGDTPRGDTDTAPAIRGLRDANGDPVAGIVGGAEVWFTTDAAAAEAVYYIEVGGGGDSGQGSSATRGFGTRSSVVDTRGNSDGGSDYRLWASDITETRDTTDDYRSGVMTTGVITEGGSVMGEIERSGDRDWFAVELVEGRLYRIDLEGHWTKAGTLFNAYLRGVYDAVGNLIDGTPNNNSGVSFNSRVYFMAPEAGTYYVAAGGYGGSKGTYTLSVRDVTDDVPDDFAPEAGTSGTVEVGGTATGKIEYAGDRDWFAVSLDAGRLYQIDLEGLDTGAGTLRDPYLRGVHDADGNRIDGTRNDDSGASKNSLAFFIPSAPATYYVAAGARGNEVGTYTLSVTDVTDDFAAGTWTSGTVEVGGTATGEINYLVDRDWFAVTLEAGKVHRIDLEGRDTGAGTLRDPYLRGVHGADGNLIDGTANDNSGEGKNSRVFFTAPEDATYYVAAGSRNTYEVGTYTLSVTEVVDDYAADTDTAGTVMVGGTATGEINSPGDRDWFAVTLEAGKVYRIDLKGWDAVAGTLRDPYLRGFHGADGNLIDGTTDNNGAGRNSRVFFTAPEDADATYYVSAGASGSSAGTYTLSVTDVVDDYAADTTTTGRVAVGGSVPGNIETAGDRDWFAVQLVAGRGYRIYLGTLDRDESGPGRLRDSYLRGVYDSEGNRFPHTTDDFLGYGLDSLVTFTPTESGIYYIAAGGDRGLTGAYTLSVKEFVDDFPATPATTGTIEVGGSATGTIQEWLDVDWFAVELEAGHIYRIYLEGRLTGAGTLPYPAVKGVYDENSVTVLHNYDNFSPNLVMFTPTESGTYYVPARNLNKYGSRGTYRLWVKDVTDDFAADTDTTGTVMVGGTVTGEIAVPWDRDWFAVTLEAGKVYRFDLEGRDTGAGTLGDPYLRGVHDDEGNLINGTTDDNSGTGNNSRVTYRATEDATYYVSAGSFQTPTKIFVAAYTFAAASASSEGTYTLSVEEVTDGM